VWWEGVGGGSESVVGVFHHKDFEDVEEEVACYEFREDGACKLAACVVALNTDGGGAGYGA